MKSSCGNAGSAAPSAGWHCARPGPRRGRQDRDRACLRSVTHSLIAPDPSAPGPGPGGDLPIPRGSRSTAPERAINGVFSLAQLQAFTAELEQAAAIHQLR